MNSNLNYSRTVIKKNSSNSSDPDYLTSVAEKNRQYHQTLHDLRTTLIDDFGSLNNIKAQQALQEDDELGLTTMFYIMLTACGGVNIIDGIPEIVNCSQHIYDKWDKTKICLTSNEDLRAMLAMDLIDTPEDGFYLCTPNILSDSDVELFESAFTLACSHETAQTCLSYGCLGKKYPLASIPDWAIYVLAQNAFDAIATDMINQQAIIFFSNKYSRYMGDELEKDSYAMIEPLLCDTGFANELFIRPVSLDSVEPWKIKALSSSKYALNSHDDEMGKIYQIYTLWTKMCRELSVASIIRADQLNNSEVVRDNLKKLGECICARTAVEALLSGVPMDDILA